MPSTSNSILSRLHRLRQRAFRLNFYRCHLGYFVITILVASGVLYGSSGNGLNDYHLSYTDALTMAASAMTTTGLNPVNLNVLTGYQQSVLFVLMILGDLSTVSISVVVARRYMFRRQMSKYVSKHKAARTVLRQVDEEIGERHARGGRSADQRDSVNSASTGSSIKRSDSKDRKLAQDKHRHHQSFGAFPAPWETQIFRKAFGQPAKWARNSQIEPGAHHYLSFEPKLDQKGRLRGLSSEESEELGGVEYRALQSLCWILPTYTAFWIFLSMVILTPYAVAYPPIAETIRTSQPGSLSPGWWGVFISVSSYTNCGLDLLKSSMMPFRNKWLILIVSGGAVAAGNTFYPIFLRIYVWLISEVIPKNSEMYHGLSFLLHHPRRCYLWLFDRKTTWILAGVQLGLILLEWVLFEILNIHQTAVWAIPPDTRTMDGLYQSFGTRSSGFYIVQMSSIAPALKVVYLIIMYLSVSPLIVSLRSTNVYEERSVGLEADLYETNRADKEKSRSEKQNPSAGMHIQNQLAYDLWWIALAWCLITIIEEAQLNDAAGGYNNFTILFEVISAYGNCGLTLGVPYDSFALCGSFHALSKLILITVMLRGRHRILPMALDRSILLPGQEIMLEMDKHYNPGISEERDVDEVRREERGGQAEDPKGKQDPANDGTRKNDQGNER
ncbi:hypothetical protein LTR27_008684 [Elasticomyces elasticus]|nr:hypothetical protein LTR27_008684 [Elasticomyces elasticus]